MYQPAHFKEERINVLHQLVRDCPLGSLVTMTEAGLTANHIPFEIDPSPAPFGTLRGHVARANPIWQDFVREQEVMVLFQGANTYISPSWYPSKREHGKVVPTWNYAVVHAHGPMKVIEDAAWLLDLVTRLTDHHEGKRTAPWKVGDAPADYLDTMIRSIVGIEIPLTRLVGKWKVSQNRGGADRDGVIAGLREIETDEAEASANLVPPSSAA
jgi:transcriptional regulator